MGGFVMGFFSHLWAREPVALISGVLSILYFTYNEVRSFRSRKRKSSEELEDKINELKHMRERIHQIYYSLREKTGNLFSEMRYFFEEIEDRPNFSSQYGADIARLTNAMMRIKEKNDDYAMDWRYSRLDHIDQAKNVVDAKDIERGLAEDIAMAEREEQSTDLVLREGKKILNELKQKLHQ